MTTNAMATSMLVNAITSTPVEIKTSSTMVSVTNLPKSPTSDNILSIIAPVVVIVVLGVVCGIIAAVIVVTVILKRKSGKKPTMHDQEDTLQFKDLANPVYTSMISNVFIRTKLQYISHKQVIVPAFHWLLLNRLITLNFQVIECITLLDLQLLPVFQVVM